MHHYYLKIPYLTCKGFLMELNIHKIQLFAFNPEFHNDI